MSLNSLPTEILRKIFYDLECSLTNVALVCRRLNDIAEPILYEEFRGENPSALEGYMKAIIRRPHLVEYIKSFNSPTAREDLSTINQEVELPWYTEENHDRLRGYLQDDIYGKEKCDRWYNSLNNRCNYEVVLGFLLNLVATHVERLVLRTEGYRPCVQLVAEEAAKAQQAPTGVQSTIFSKLRTVHLHYMTHPADMIDMDFVLPYVKLKSVVCLSVHGLADENPLFKRRTDPFSDSGEIFSTRPHDPFQVFSIIDLTLTRVRLNSRSIKNFLAHFHALKHFRYEDTTTHVLDPNVLSATVAGLEHSKHCLEFLLLRRTGGHLIQEQVYDEYGPFVSMKGFEKLRTLIIDRCVLIGKDSRATVEREPHIPRLRYAPEKCQAVLAGLPKTLARLEIEDCRTSVFGFFDFLDALLPEFEPSPLPNLTTIRLTFNGEENHRIVEALWKEENWEQRALQKGITLTRVDHISQ